MSAASTATDAMAQHFTETQLIALQLLFRAGQEQRDEQEESITYDDILTDAIRARACLPVGWR